MDRFELVEKLVKSTGVGYEDAKAALEASNWDLLEAAVWLEKNNKAEARSARYGSTSEEQPAAETPQESGTRGSASGNPNSFAASVNTFFGKVKNILLDNNFVLCRKNGEVIVELPVWIIILVIIIWWPILLVILAALVIGFRFKLNGPDLGSKTVNRVINAAENAVDSAFRRVKNAAVNARGTAANDTVEETKSDENKQN